LKAFKIDQNNKRTSSNGLISYSNRIRKLQFLQHPQERSRVTSLFTGAYKKQHR